MESAGAPRSEPASAAELLRSRLMIYGQVGAGLSLLALLMGALPGLFVPAVRDPDWPLKPFSLYVVATGVVFGIVWLIGRMAVRARVGVAADAFATFTACALQGFAVAADPDPDGSEAWGVVIVILIVLGRAVIVPSNGSRTLLISTLGALPMPLAIYVTLAHLTEPPQPAQSVASSLASVVYLTLGVALSVVASRVIFGLREQLRATRKLGRYTLGAKIGEGGMGVVYRATHAFLRRPAALKLLPRDRMDDRSIARFEREVQLASQLQHPNAVTIYDYGRANDGTFYYAMELIDGLDLERLVDKHGAQPQARVVRIMRQVAGVLADAHQQGLIHRDIKPSNVLVGCRGSIGDYVTVVDFGLAKSLDAATPNLTRTDVIIGTPLYLAPEAILDPDKVGAQSDVYAMGCVAYWLLAGRPVFTGKTTVGVCDRILHDAPQRPSEVLAKPLDEALEELVIACLAKKPSSRPKGAADVLERLARLESWSDAEALAWWRESQSQVPIATVAYAPESELQVDVAHR